MNQPLAMHQISIFGRILATPPGMLIDLGFHNTTVSSKLLATLLVGGDMTQNTLMFSNNPVSTRTSHKYNCMGCCQRSKEEK